MIRKGNCDLETYLVCTQATRTVCQPDMGLLLLLPASIRDLVTWLSIYILLIKTAAGGRSVCIHIAYVHDFYVKLVYFVE